MQKQRQNPTRKARQNLDSTSRLIEALPGMNPSALLSKWQIWPPDKMSPAISPYSQRSRFRRSRCDGLILLVGAGDFYKAHFKSV
jgi:hypothetical protein